MLLFRLVISPQFIFICQMETRTGQLYIYLSVCTQSLPKYIGDMIVLREKPHHENHIAQTARVSC